MLFGKYKEKERKKNHVRSYRGTCIITSQNNDMVLDKFNNFLKELIGYCVFG